MPDDYEIRSGSVLSVDGARALVRLDKPEEDCGGCRSCALKGLCHDRNAAFVDIPVDIPEGRTVAAGERVRVAYAPASPATAALALFLPSLLGLAGGGWLAGRLFGGGDGTFLAGTAAGVVAGLAVTLAVNRAFRAASPRARLVPD